MYNVNIVCRAASDYLADPKSMTHNIAYFYVTTYDKVNNNIFGVKKYDYRNHIRQLCMGEGHISDFSNLVAVMLVYYITQTHPKRFTIKKKSISSKLKDIFQSEDLSIDSLLNKIDLSEIENETPAWFYQTIKYLNSIKSTINVTPALYFLLYKLVSSGNNI